jgi:hypothetical protein
MIAFNWAVLYFAIKVVARFKNVAGSFSSLLVSSFFTGATVGAVFRI